MAVELAETDIELDLILQDMEEVAQLDILEAEELLHLALQALLTQALLVRERSPALRHYTRVAVEAWE
jgi:hypothetical protein